MSPRGSQTRWDALDPMPLLPVDRWLIDDRVFWAARLHDLTRFVEQEHNR